MKVLIVDDDESLSSIISTALEKEGYTTFLANNGKDAVIKAKSEIPNLVLLDQVLPDISGNEVLKQLKMDEEMRNIPVIMLSTFSQEDLASPAINDGAADYVFKYQVEVADIINKVKGALRSNEANAS